MSRLLVIGGPTVDRLHLQERTVNAVGGAGMYTAMAAHRCGAQVSMFGLCPDPCPEPLKPVAERLAEWLGLAVPPARLPQFEISYRGGRTEYLRESRGDEPELTPTMLPDDLSEYDLVHVTAQASVVLQLAFVQACRRRSAVRISAGTEPGHAAQQPQFVRAVLDASDIFFMNELEAESVFGSFEAARVEPGRVLYITLGADGARVLQGGTPSVVPRIPARTLDPTGAGDTFCGATLGYLLQKHHPIMAAHRAAALAAEMIGSLGPAALLSDDPPPEVPLDPRVCVDADQVQRVAAILSATAEAIPYPWVGPTFPPEDHPQAVDWLFAATLQQFSFWTVRDNRYHLPLIEPIDGVERKGSDYLHAALTRRLEQDPGFCSPERQAALTRDELLKVFRADNGKDPMPALDLHLNQARQYGRDMLALGLTPQAVVDQARAAEYPLQSILLTLDQIGGYKEDPLRKKSLLLAMGLNDRPERFLPLRVDEPLAPIMDYHMMRSCLRMGLIQVDDGALRAKLVDRQVVSPEEEWAVRYPAYLAYDQLVRQSGRGLTAVNGFLFGNARKTCPEMTEPQCHNCLLDAVCAHRQEYFQPVLRTTFY